MNEVKKKIKSGVLFFFPSKIQVFLSFLVFFVFISIFIFFSSVYINRPYNQFIRSVSSIIPIPLGTLQEDIIYYHDIAELAAFIDATEQVSENFENDAFILAKSTPFNRAIEIYERRYYLEQVAEELQVQVEKMDEASVDDGLKEILSLISWDQEDYMHYIIEPLYLQQEVDAAVKKYDAYQEGVYREMGHLEDQLEEGFSFSDMAFQLSDHISSSSYGDIGYLSFEEDGQGDFSELFLVNREIGEVTEILESRDFFYIAQVYDRIEDGEDVLYGVQIATKNKKNLAQVLDQKLLEGRVMLFVD